MEICPKDFFQTLHYDNAQKVVKNQLGKISQKILVWAKWAILAQFWVKIMPVYTL